MREKTLVSDDGLIQKVSALISANFELPADFFPLHEHTRLYGSGVGLDSFDALRLVAALEEEFDITIEDTELTPSTFESVGSIILLIRGKLP
jgi:acyl carrier protein